MHAAEDEVARPAKKGTSYPVELGSKLHSLGTWKERTEFAPQQPPEQSAAQQAALSFIRGYSVRAAFSLVPPRCQDCLAKVAQFGESGKYLRRAQAL